MLTRLAAHLRAHRGGAPGEEVEEATITLSDDCAVGSPLDRED